MNTTTRPRLQRASAVRYELQGPVSNYIKAVTSNWLIRMPVDNPAVLEMFKEPDRKPYRSLVPWAGEFAGKYLTGAVQVYRLNGNALLKESIANFVAKFISLQKDDGYLGPFPSDNRLMKGQPPVEVRSFEGSNHWGDIPPWDVWGHYHAISGLLLWHEETRDVPALECAIRIGDMLCQKFLDTDLRIVELGFSETNHAALHAMGLLYHFHPQEKYLRLARQIAEEEFAEEGGGDYLRVALDGKEFFEGPKPRWESLHPIQGLAELFWLTGEEKFSKAYQQIWWSIAKLDRHNNGGFSSGEQAKGNPYDRGPIETCCTVAWITLGIDMLRLTGSSIVADELELSTLNQVIAYQDHSGEWCSYDTPMEGRREESTKQIGFQIRPGSEEVNCCSANAPRGFGMISDWALMSSEEGLVLNWYGESKMTASVQGTAVHLQQATDYPKGGAIRLTITPEKEIAFVLRLRIPHWSRRTSVRVNDQAVSPVLPGQYLSLDRLWKKGDIVELDLDMSLHYWVGEKEFEKKASIYRGPVLLAREVSAGSTASEEPVFDATRMEEILVEDNHHVPSIVSLKVKSLGHGPILLRDFASVGNDGVSYTSWLNVENLEPAPFSVENPLRSTRLVKPRKSNL